VKCLVARLGHGRAVSLWGAERSASWTLRQKIEYVGRYEKACGDGTDVLDFNNGRWTWWKKVYMPTKNDSGGCR